MNTMIQENDDQLQILNHELKISELELKLNAL
jgi:hypothetical protein